MARRKIDPLRPLTDDEVAILTRMSRSQSESTARVAPGWPDPGCRPGRRLSAGRRVDRPTFRRRSLASGRSLQRRRARRTRPSPWGGRAPIYDQPSRERILQEARRQPTPEADGTASWSLTTLPKALRSAPDGLPRVSTYTIGRVLHEAGASPQKNRSWCPTGTVLRKRKSGIVEVTDPNTSSKKN